MRALITAVALLTMATPATAGLLIYEGFDYTVGQDLSGRQNATNSTLGNVPWIAPSAPAQAPPSVNAQVIYNDNFKATGFTAPTGMSVMTPRTQSGTSDANRINIPGGSYARASSQSLFVSFSMKLLEWDPITDVQAANSTHRLGDYFAGFHGGDAAAGGAASDANGFAGEVFVRRHLYDGGLQDPSGVGTDLSYEFGVTKNLSTSPIPPLAQPVFDTTKLFKVGDIVYIVMEYDLNTGTNLDVARLWINPSPSDVAAAAASPTVSSQPNAPNLGGTLPIWSFILRSGTNLPGDIAVDEIRIGTTFEDVFAVPEPSSLLLVGFGLAVVGIRRKRS